MARSAVKVYWDRKKLVDRRGHGAVEFQVYLGRGERKFYSIALATPMEWVRMKNSKDFLREVQKYEDIIEEMRTSGEAMTIANLDARLEVADVVKNARKTSQTKDGFDLSESFLEFVRDFQTQENVTKQTMKHKRVVLRSIENFGLLRTFEDLTPANIMAYDRWLHNGVRTDVTIATYHKYTRYYINVLRMEERIPSDPYAHVKIRKGESKMRMPLTEEEVIKVAHFQTERPRLERARDLFVFMSYTGLSYIDTQNFDFKKMAKWVEEDGLWYIDGKRTKTKTAFFTPILPAALEVLKRYDNKLPKVSNQKLNEALHIIEERLEISNPMTCHIARHSFATMCLSYGFSIEEVSKMLGHTNIKTTQRYAKVLNTSIRKRSSQIAKMMGQVQAAL